MVKDYLEIQSRSDIIAQGKRKKVNISFSYKESSSDLKKYKERSNESKLVNQYTELEQIITTFERTQPTAS